MGLVRKNIRYAFLFLDILRKKELKTSVINVKKDRKEKKAIYLDEIWRLIESKTIKNKTLIMADIQTNGKGTHGRIWHTDAVSYTHLRAHET